LIKIARSRCRSDTDATIAVLAARYATTRVLTLDHKHFRAMQPLQGGGSFTILPGDG
jgi:predicted nucleic acid-binding protein